MAADKVVTPNVNPAVLFDTLGNPTVVDNATFPIDNVPRICVIPAP